MDFDYPQNKPDTILCRQDQINLSSFVCILNYIAGIPNASFKIQASFSKNGLSASTSLNVNPL